MCINANIRSITELMLGYENGEAPITESEPLTFTLPDGFSTSGQLCRTLQKASVLPSRKARYAEIDGKCVDSCRKAKEQESSISTVLMKKRWARIRRGCLLLLAASETAVSLGQMVEGQLTKEGFHYDFPR